MFKKLITLILAIGLANVLTVSAVAKTSAEKQDEIQFPQ